MKINEKKIRNKDVVAEYRKPGSTMISVGKLFGISDERVRQIVEAAALATCKIHKEKYSKECTHCSLDALYNREIPMPELLEIIDRLKARDRTKFVHYERSLLIEYLRDNLKLSLPFIGKLLDRDHTTISHHLRK